MWTIEISGVNYVTVSERRLIFFHHSVGNVSYLRTENSRIILILQDEFLSLSVFILGLRVLGIY